MAAKSTKRKKSTKSTPRKKQQTTEIQSEIIILATLAVSILLVLSNFGAGGIVGEAVSSFFFGLFGFMAYILPFCTKRFISGTMTMVLTMAANTI